MRSTNLLPVLQKQPTDASHEDMSSQDMITRLAGTDRATFAAEFIAAVSFSLWGVFDRANVDEHLAAAYQDQFPLEYENVTVYEQWEAAVQLGPESGDAFFNELGGKVVESHTTGFVAASEFTNVEVASLADQAGWEFGTQDLFVQAQAESHFSGVEYQHVVGYNTEYLYAHGFEVYDQVVVTSADTAGMVDTGFDYVPVEGIADGLETLSAGEGILIPDGAVDLIPYAGAIVLGVRLILGALKAERDFKAVDRTAKNRIHVVQTLTLMSRMGISTVLATAGGAGLGTAGSFLPGIGNVIGGVAGTVIGASAGMYLNKHLQPHMLDLALNITGLTHDDLFYYKNKSHIDEVALAFHTRAREAGATPG